VVLVDVSTEVRDVGSLSVPNIGRVARLPDEVWELLGAADEPVPAWASFRAELVAEGCSGATCRSYAYDLLRWLRFLAAVDVSWQVAERREVRDFVRWLRQAPNPARLRAAVAGGRHAAGTLNVRTGKAYLSAGYAPRTINHALSVLSEFYRHAIDAELGPLRNPVPERRGAGAARRVVRGGRRGPGYRQREPLAQPRALSDELISEVFAGLRHDRDRALVSIALSSGARASELLSMVRGGVDVGRGVVSVIPKGSTTRIWIPVAPDSIVWLGRYLAQLPAATVDAPIWTTLRSPVRPLTYFALRQVLERVNRQLGTNVTWHDFRHTFTHRLLDDERLSLTDVQALLRHRSLSTLADYSAVRLDELVARLHEHVARPAPRPLPALGYSSVDMQVLFPGLAL
jgi:integrase/recombinase XerC